MLKQSSTKMKIKFLRYEQSSQCKTMRDSSVSYASAAAKVDAWSCVNYGNELLHCLRLNLWYDAFYFVLKLFRKSCPSCYISVIQQPSSLVCYLIFVSYIYSWSDWRFSKGFWWNFLFLHFKWFCFFCF